MALNAIEPPPLPSFPFGGGGADRKAPYVGVVDLEGGIPPSGGGIANDPLLSKLARLVPIVAASTGDVGLECANWIIEAGVGAREEKYPEKPDIAGEGSTPALFGAEAGS
jgi:hypothetical protein